jgi:hypothetical protein
VHYEYQVLQHNDWTAERKTNQRLATRLVVVQHPSPYATSDLQNH